LTELTCDQENSLFSHFTDSSDIIHRGKLHFIVQRQGDREGLLMFQTSFPRLGERPHQSHVTPHSFPPQRYPFMPLTSIYVLVLHKWLSFSNLKPIYFSTTTELQLCCKSKFSARGRTKKPKSRPPVRAAPWPPPPKGTWVYRPPSREIYYEKSPPPVAARACGNLEELDQRIVLTELRCFRLEKHQAAAGIIH
jgi:hypothetical protein